MLKTVRLVVLAGVTLAGAYNAYAAPAGALGKCYDRVIAACNKTNHPSSCAEGGMNQCDEVYPVPMTFDPNRGNLRIAPRD